MASPQPAPELRRILVVDDEESLRHMLGTLLRRAGYEPHAVASGSEAMTELGEKAYDVVLTDLRMPRMSGIELLEQIALRGAGAPTVIVMSAYGSFDIALEAMKKGAYDYISKPFKPDEIVLVLRKAEEREGLKRENRKLREALDKHSRTPRIVARSARMEEVLRAVRKIAEYKTTVLVTGESGTGKELVARALHDLGPRAARAFVAVNCGAIPPALLESELFGHVKGAFTDASRDKKGLFEEAEAGTLFLDEIGELPLALQVKLLRALQEEKIRRVGDTREIDIDARVVAATARDLGDEVREGRFREDLYYRLNVVHIAIPPLRDRREEIPPLIEHFLARHNQRLGTKIEGVAPDAMRLLMEYPWPGNVRELENTIEHAIVLAERARIEGENLPARVRESHDRVRVALSGSDLSIKRTTRALEEELIRRALRKTGGNRTAAARHLEISYRALLYKMKEFGILS
ncbi:MAG: sigma-54 dependent transcriptional regulator [Myxococcota bacterium]